MELFRQRVFWVFHFLTTVSLIGGSEKSRRVTDNNFHIRFCRVHLDTDRYLTFNLIDNRHIYGIYQRISKYYTIAATSVIHRVRLMVFNAAFNNISAISWWKTPEYLVKTTDLSHCQTKSHNVVSSTPPHERDSNSKR